MFLKILIALLVIALLASIGSKQPSPSTSPSTSGSPSPSASGSPITKANYDKIKTGMTLAEVEKILGKGRSQGSSEVYFGGQKIATSNYAWSEWGKTITVVVQNGKVTTKAQFGLD